MDTDRENISQSAIERRCQMGLMDKMRDQASQLATKAQEGVSSAQGKLSDTQEKHRKDGFYRDLGELEYSKYKGIELPDFDSKHKEILDELDKFN
ncbi:MAG: hypothetical protein HKL80_05170 [Acidimicrobiales bacterium]|nr:hypothetical protein [Acidimicrobiales bacterium]